MDERFIYIPSQSSTSSPVEDSEQCLFDELPFLNYGKEEEIADSVPDNDDEHQSAFYRPQKHEKNEHDIAAECLDNHMKNKRDIWTSTGDICYVLPKTEALSPNYRYKTNSSKKDRTPRTAMKMMERHRENERTRHHNLNDSLKEICTRIPGAHQDGRETKVVMMQRIISYVAYLENTIITLCSELEVPYKRTLTPLTLQLRKEMGRRPVYNMEALHLPENMKKEKRITCRKLKLSSPTIDSTSDHQVPQAPTSATSSFQQDSQESMVPSSTFIPLLNDNALSPWLFSTQEDKDVLDDGFETMFGQEAGENTGLNFPTALTSLSSPRTMVRQQEVPEPLHLLSSPDLKGDKENISTFNLGGNIMKLTQSERYGSQRDTSFDPDMPDSLAVSPDTVLPTIQIPSSSSAFFSPVQSASLLYRPTPLTPAARKNKRKQYTPQQYTPKRSPFSNIINLSGTEDCRRDEESDEEESQSLRSLGLTRHQKAEIALLESRSSRPPSSSSEGSNIAKRTGKTDLRKTSWMNGFMMYSRLNRRKFIEANPGVHTSHISKIMGHAWRNMSPEDQNPYKEKAKLCAQELQKQQQLEELSASPAVTSPEKSNLFDSGFASASSYLALEDSA